MAIIIIRTFENLLSLNITSVDPSSYILNGRRHDTQSMLIIYAFLFNFLSFIKFKNSHLMRLKQNHHTFTRFKV